jgi:transcriptional regulator with GAF, ATPase, and Fis domain
MSSQHPATNNLADESAAVAAVAATLVRPHDVLGVVVDILTAAAHTAGAAAGGLILRRLGQDRLQLLAATSHRAEELELYQTQHEQGPCFDAVETGEHVTAGSTADIETRWPHIATAFQRAGFEAVHAVPLSWHGDVIGALNLFFTLDHAPTGAPLQVFADLAALAIVHAAPITTTQILTRTRSALDERTVLEQAKGVLAQQGGLPMDAAYQLLLDTARQRGEQLTATSAHLVAQAGTRNPAAG